MTKREKQLLRVALNFAHTHIDLLNEVYDGTYRQDDGEEVCVLVPNSRDFAPCFEMREFSELIFKLEDGLIEVKELKE